MIWLEAHPALRGLFYAAVLLGGLVFVQRAAADCSCLCMADGSQQRLCTTPDEANADTGFCLAPQQLQSGNHSGENMTSNPCPVVPGFTPQEFTGSPPANATDCTTAQVWDSVYLEFREVVTCKPIDADAA